MFYILLILHCGAARGVDLYTFGWALAPPNPDFAPPPNDALGPPNLDATQTVSKQVGTLAWKTVEPLLKTTYLCC